jgi:hypothetical protein
MGLSYPPNAVWRYRALNANGRSNVVLGELRKVWSVLPSVLQNNTLAETWEHLAGTRDSWSHCPVAPLEFLLDAVIGVRPLEPGYKSLCISPLPSDIGDTSMKIHTPFGDIQVQSEKSEKGQIRIYSVPIGIERIDFNVGGTKWSASNTGEPIEICL